MSEVLVLGTYSEGGVVLVTPDKKVQNGDKLGWRGESHNGGNHMLSLRNATEADLGEIRRIYEYAQDYMIRSGNPTQWGHFYPSADLIRSDIQKRSAR